VNASSIDVSDRLRAILLGIVAIGALGLLLELAFLDHRDSATQWIPYFVLAIVLIATAIVWRRASSETLRLFQIVMGAAFLTGLLGVILHFRGNVAFETERDTTLHGRRLVWEALHGATPALAPGALVQLALVGFAFAYRHPAGRTENRRHNGDEK
jgi:hypothetical protein